jgi:S-formylglutathione hydrolase FrmB
VSAHMAALIERLPEGMSNAGASLAYIGPAFGSPPDPSFWQQNSPFTFARKSRLTELKICFDCGRNDEYGFDAGAEALDRLLSARKVPHEFHIYPGGHGLEYFMRHFPASVEFHSKAFGLTK